MAQEDYSPLDPQRETNPVEPLRPEHGPYGSEPAGPAPAGLGAPFIARWPGVDAIAAAIDDGLYVAGPDGRIVMANEGFVRLLGAETPESLIGLRIDSFPADEHLRRHPIPTGPMWVKAFDGREVLTQHVRIESLSLGAGASAGLFRRAGSDRLAALGVGVTSILHDLRNVLTGIVGNADEVGRLTDVEGRNEAARRLRDLALFGNAIAEQLVNFAAPSHGARRACHVNQAIEETVRSFQGRVPPTVQLKFELADGIAPIWVETTQVRQLVMNLLLNAVSAMSGEVGTVTFRTSQQDAAPRLPLSPRIERRPRGQYGVVEVTDTGRGISSAELGRVFKPFVTTTGGTGLGLAVVREILLRCGGGIEIESEVGVGSTFRLFLPIKD